MKKEKKNLETAPAAPKKSGPEAAGRRRHLRSDPDISKGKLLSSDRGDTTRSDDQKQKNGKTT